MSITESSTKFKWIKFNSLVILTTFQMLKRHSWCYCTAWHSPKWSVFMCSRVWLHIILPLALTVGLTDSLSQAHAAFRIFLWLCLTWEQVVVKPLVRKHDHIWFMTRASEMFWIRNGFELFVFIFFFSPSLCVLIQFVWIG